jgi:hypothetical protein
VLIHALRYPSLREQGVDADLRVLARGHLLRLDGHSVGVNRVSGLACSSKDPMPSSYDSEAG